MRSNEKNSLDSVFKDPFLLAGRIEATAEAMIPQIEYIHDILALTPEKRELLGNYADNYKADIDRVENVLYVMNELVYLIKGNSNDISMALIEEDRRKAI